MIGRTDTSANTAAAPGSAEGRHADRVSLSHDAQRIADEQRSNEALVHFDGNRVAALKQAIESGNFRIDSTRIADKVSLQYGGR